MGEKRMKAKKYLLFFLFYSQRFTVLFLDFPYFFPGSGKIFPKRISIFLISDRLVLRSFFKGKIKITGISVYSCAVCRSIIFCSRNIFQFLSGFFCQLFFINTVKLFCILYMHHNIVFIEIRKTDARQFLFCILRII